MNQDIEDLLTSGLLSVPDDFTARIMREIQSMPHAEPPVWQKILHWLAITGAVALGANELFSSIFGIWIATTAY